MAAGQGQLFWYEIVARDVNSNLLFDARVQATTSDEARLSSKVDKFLNGKPAVVAVMQLDDNEVKVGWTPPTPPKKV